MKRHAGGIGRNDDGPLDPDEPTGFVARILASSAVDGSGNRAVVFLQGCDFDCLYCHNPETRSPCTGCGLCVPACRFGALVRTSDGMEWHRERCADCGSCIGACPRDSSPKVRLMTVSEVLSELLPVRRFIRGITISGGECALQSAYLESLLIRSREAGLPGLVDTNGSTDFRTRSGLVEAAEGFMLDVKAWNDREHLALTGASNGTVFANLRFLCEIGKLAEVRTVVVPGLFDAEETVREVSAVVAAACSPARYKLIRFRPNGVRRPYMKLPVPDDDTMDGLAGIARGQGVREVLVN